MASIFKRLHVANPRPLCDRFLRFIVRCFFRGGEYGITSQAAHERSFRVRCRHRSTVDYSLDGDTVDGATVVGSDPAFIQPVDPRVLYWYNKAYNVKMSTMLNYILK